MFYFGHMRYAAIPDCGDSAVFVPSAAAPPYLLAAASVSASVSVGSFVINLPPLSRSECVGFERRSSTS